jgi:hypothetical protein
VKVLRRVGPPCNCQAKCLALAQDQKAIGTPLYVGSEIRCDCGSLFRLYDDQRDGMYWGEVQA